MSKAIIIFSFFSIPFLNAQIESIDIDSKEYVEWVGSCETDVVEKAQLKGLGSLTAIERVRYYLDTQRCKYKAQSKLVHAQVDDKQLKEDAKNSSRFRGKSGSITYCVGAFLLYLTLTNGQKMVST
ncbi:MAG: hypothetical protein VW833_06855 [Candidatus Neomarinimicrobiota bacterium]